MASVQGAVADAAPWHRAGGIGEGDGWLRCHRLQVTALSSPGAWEENKRLSVPAARMWGDTTRGDMMRDGAECLRQRRHCPCSLSPQPGVTTAPPPAQHPRDHLLRVCSGPVCHRQPPPQSR